MKPVAEGKEVTPRRLLRKQKSVEVLGGGQSPPYHGAVPVPWRVLNSTPSSVNVSKVLKKQMFLYNQGF